MNSLADYDRMLLEADSKGYLAECGLTLETVRSLPLHGDALGATAMPTCVDHIFTYVLGREIAKARGCP